MGEIVDAQKYLKMAIVGVMSIVVLVVGYGIYINAASRRHIEKMEAARYTVLPVAYADYRDICATVDNMNITARAAWMIDINAQYEGVVSEIRVSQNQRVAKGDVLAVMNNNDLMANIASAEADIQEARAKLLNAEQTAKRYRLLVEKNAISKQEYDNAVNMRDAARAQLDSRIARRDLVRSEQDKMVIVAPQSANIIQIYREPGKYIRAGEALFMMADLSVMNAYSILSHDTLRRLSSVGNRFVLEVKPHRLTHKAYPFGENMSRTDLKFNQFAMTLVHANPDINTDADYHEVSWRLENPSGIFEPTYYDAVKIMSQDTAHVLVIPNRSIQKDGKTGKTFVFTLDENQKLARRFVVCGITNGELTEIVEGLSKGDAAVVAEPFGYTEGMKVGVTKYDF